MAKVDRLIEVEMRKRSTRSEDSGPDAEFAQLLGEQSDTGRKVEFGRDALLDAVDHRQFGVALFGFLQQALGFVEQAGRSRVPSPSGGNGLPPGHRLGPKVCSRS